MNKYDEIMSNVNVSKDTEKRILDNVHNKVSGNKNHRMMFMGKRLIPLIVVVVIAIGISVFYNARNENAVVLGTPDFTVEVETKEEMEKIVGYEVEFIEDLPFTTTEITYTIIDQSIARIYYGNLSSSISFQKSEYVEDKTDDPILYDLNEVIIVNGIEVLCQGSRNGYTDITWNNDDFQYYITSSDAYDLEEWTDILEHIVHS